MLSTRLAVSRIVFHLDHLVLRGVRVDDKDSFSAGLKTELARVVATSSRFGTDRVAPSMSRTCRARARRDSARRE